MNVEKILYISFLLSFQQNIVCMHNGVESAQMHRNKQCFDLCLLEKEVEKIENRMVHEVEPYDKWQPNSPLELGDIFIANANANIGKDAVKISLLKRIFKKNRTKKSCSKMKKYHKKQALRVKFTEKHFP